MVTSTHPQRTRRLRQALLTTVLLCAAVRAAWACDPLPNWRAPTPQEALARAEVVVQARVLAVSGNDPWAATVEVLRTFKGTLGTTQIRTASGALCGTGPLDVGRTYVWFFPDARRLFVNLLAQPQGLSAEQLVQALAP